MKTQKIKFTCTFCGKDLDSFLVYIENNKKKKRNEELFHKWEQDIIKLHSPNCVVSPNPKLQELYGIQNNN
jgi:hypothetical protein